MLTIPALLGLIVGGIIAIGLLWCLLGGDIKWPSFWEYRLIAIFLLCAWLWMPWLFEWLSMIPFEKLFPTVESSAAWFNPQTTTVE